MGETFAARAYPEISDKMQDMAKRAEVLGLQLTQFNSGSAHNSANGFRLFRMPLVSNRHFGGGELGHLKSRREVECWLAGYAAALGVRV